MPRYPRNPTPKEPWDGRHWVEGHIALRDGKPVWVRAHYSDNPNDYPIRPSDYYDVPNRTRTERTFYGDEVDWNAFDQAQSYARGGNVRMARRMKARARAENRAARRQEA